MARQFDVIIERDEEGYYIASVPQLPACHTQARSLDEVIERIREAIELYLEVLKFSLRRRRIPLPACQRAITLFLGSIPVLHDFPVQQGPSITRDGAESPNNP